MGKIKNKHYEKRKFESTGSPSDTSANIYMSMLTSAAWKELTQRQQILYLYCKAQYYAEKKKPIKDDALSFTMNQSKWRDLYGLYKNYTNGFYNDINSLIEHGFIICIESGAIRRTKSIYYFSDKWQKYGTPDFEILPSEMTNSMLKKVFTKTK